MKIVFEAGARPQFVKADIVSQELRKRRLKKYSFIQVNIMTLICHKCF